MFWHNLRRLIGFILIQYGWRIYPRCPERMVLTRYLAEWSDMVVKGGK
jgi:hypothetical protein